MRLGFAVKVLGRPQLKSNDSRRWQNHPHLSVSLAYLRDILFYLRDTDIRMYRMQSDLAPYATHPDLPEFHHQVEECEAELAYVGELARELDVRLSFHAHPYTVLNSPDPGVTTRSIQAAVVLANILNGMGLGPEAVIVTHVGGVYGDRQSALERFAQRYQDLPEHARARLVLENDDGRYSVTDILGVNQQVGIPLVFDRLHHLVNNPERMPVREAMRLCLATWPAGVQPKIHYSSPRTEMKAVIDVSGESPGEVARLRSTPWRNHSDYINPFEFLDFMRQVEGLAPFGVMIEAKAKDLAVLRLRQDVAELDPALAARLQLGAHAP